MKIERLSIKWNYWLLIYLSLSIFLYEELKKKLRMGEKEDVKLEVETGKMERKN